MKNTMIIAVCAVAATCAAFALDTTVSNDFWCTWNYPNGDSAVSEASAAASSPLNSRVATALPSNTIEIFSSHPFGCVIIVR